MEVDKAAAAASVEKRAVWRQNDVRGGANADVLAARNNIVEESERRIVDFGWGGDANKLSFK